MIAAVDVSNWGYGTLGECLDVLLYEDPNLVAKLHLSINLLLRESDGMDLAVRAATVALSHAKDKRKELSELASGFPDLIEHEWFRDVSDAVTESGRFSLYF